MDEITLIRRCQKGDRDAFRAVVEIHRQIIFSLAFRMLCDESTAKDIVQETFIRAWQNIQRFDTSRPLRTWLYTIAVRLCQDALEKSSRTTPLPDEPLPDLVSNLSPDRSMENREMGAAIHSLTQRLSPKQKLVFTLACLESLGTKEIAAMTGLTPDQIKSNLFQARKTMKEQLKRLGYE